MKQPTEELKVMQAACNIMAELQVLPEHNTPNMRTIRRKFSREMKGVDPNFILDLARELLFVYEQRWIAYELIHDHPTAFQSLTEVELEEFGQGINGWWTVGSFARTLSGPAWLNGQVPDGWVEKWAHSDDLW